MPSMLFVDNEGDGSPLHRFRDKSMAVVRVAPNADEHITRRHPSRMARDAFDRDGVRVAAPTQDIESGQQIAQPHRCPTPAFIHVRSVCDEGAETLRSIDGSGAYLWGRLFIPGGK